MQRKQIHRRALPGVQTEASKLERALQLAFVNAAGALPKRPDRRHPFDNAARTANPTRPWEKFAEPLRDVATEAARIGGATADTTEERIVDAVICFLEYVLEPLETRAAADVTYVQLVREQAEALDAQARARGLGTAEARAMAVRETRDVIGVAQLYVANVRRPLGTPR
jgi:hypothetical protein